MKITTDAFNIKDKIINFLKQSKYEFYVVPDLVSPLTAVIRDLPNSITQEILLKELIDFRLDATKAIQMTSRKDGRKLSLFLINLARNEKSKSIFDLKLDFDCLKLE